MIHLHIPGLPPSTNEAYISGRGGRRILSVAGRAYKTDTTAYITRTYPTEMQALRKNEPYLMYVLFLFKERKTLLNIGYPNSTDARYKKLDVSNRLKLLEDSLALASAVDDTHYWTLVLQKSLAVDPEEDGTHIWIWATERESSGIGAKLAELRAQSGVRTL